jgi:hypothetical protein
MSINLNRDFSSAEDFVWNTPLQQWILNINANRLDDQSQWYN